MTPFKHNHLYGSPYTPHEMTIHRKTIHTRVNNRCNLRRLEKQIPAIVGALEELRQKKRDLFFCWVWGKLVWRLGEEEG